MKEIWKEGHIQNQKALEIKNFLATLASSEPVEEEYISDLRKSNYVLIGPVSDMLQKATG